MKFPLSSPSILDNDLYKFTMQCAVVKLYPHVKAKYEFINRGNHKFPKGFAEELQAHVNALANLQLNKHQQELFAMKCPYLNPAYLDYLAGYKYDPSEVKIVQNGDELSVQVEGYWYRIILWEIPLLSLISELFYKMSNLNRNNNSIILSQLDDKMNFYTKIGAKIIEFGTRRRYSYELHDVILQRLMHFQNTSFIGTSNIYFALKYNTKLLGTHAHEWFMFHAARFGFKMANTIALDRWVNVYHGDLGIALTDTFTSDVFYKQFNQKLSKLFDGVRHDSGDPIEFAEKTIEHYLKMNINPIHKTIVFSDALDPQKVEHIRTHCANKIGISFGIGTNLTNDAGVPPMNIVMKLMSVSSTDMEETPTVKLSDDHGKHTGDLNMINLAKLTLNISL